MTAVRGLERIAAWAQQIAAQLEEGGDDAKPQDRYRRDDT